MPNSASIRLGQRGGLSLEFGLVALPFLMLLLGGVELARYVYTAQAVDSYAEAMLRTTLVHVGGDTANRCLADLASAVTQPKLPAGLVAERISQRQAGCTRESNGGIPRVSVAITYRFTFLVSLFGSAEQQISRTAQRSL